MSSVLTNIVLIPFVAALVVLAIPRNFRFAIRIVALVATAITMVLGISMFSRYDAAVSGFQFVNEIPWVPALGINFSVGVDGINVGLVLMATIVGFAATAMSYAIKEKAKEFYLLLLVMIGGIFGAFACLDIFLLYFFHELALIPTFMMIGLWGKGENRNYATFKITLYLSLGALIALVGLIALYVQLPDGQRSFDMRTLTAYFIENPMASRAQHFIFPLLLFGFGILVSLWPFHTWAPLGYGAAPTATAMLHAGVLKKFGLYGLIRLAFPLMPEAAESWISIIAVLCLGNILHCGLVAMRQSNLNMLIGNSSVAHMGFVFLGLASMSLIGLTGAVVVMVAHGLLAALTFALSGYLHQQTNTLEIPQLGGLLRKLPFIGSVMVMAMMAGCGLPGFGNFVGEMLVLFGSYRAFPVVTALAVWGALVIGAVYMLRAIRHILHGPIAEAWTGVVDANWIRRIPFAILVVALLVFGFFPRLLTDKIRPAAETLLKTAGGNSRSQSAEVADPTAPSFVLR